MGVSGIWVTSSSSGAAAQAHSRSLKWPPVLPPPYASPKEIADAASAAAGSGGVSTFATDMCTKLGAPENQGTREFRDVTRAKIYPMMLNLAKAAYVYPDVLGPLSQVLQTCNGMGGGAAEATGYALAYIYSKGIVHALSTTQMLEHAYDKAGGCSSIGTVLDVAAGVVKARDVALDELHLVMQTYSPRLAACTPRDAQQRFKTVLAQGDKSVVKTRDALIGSGMQAPTSLPRASTGSGSSTATPGTAAAAAGGGAASSGGSRPPVALERGPLVAGGR